MSDSREKGEQIRHSNVCLLEVMLTVYRPPLESGRFQLRAARALMLGARSTKLKCPLSVDLARFGLVYAFPDDLLLWIPAFWRPDLRRLQWLPTCSKNPMFGFIGWIIFGLVVGIVPKLVMPGRDPGGFIVTAVIGIVGALLGGFLGRAIGLYQEGQPAGFFMAVLGSLILLFLYRMVAGRRPT